MNRKENKIIKLLEKIAEQNQQIIDNLQYRGLGYPWTKPKEPYINPAPYTNNVTCLHCGKDTGIPMLLHMVIPPEGLKCPHCGRTAVYSNSPTCQEPFSIKAVPCTGDDPTMPWQTATLKPYESVCTSTTNLDPNIKAYNNIEHIRDEDNICGGVRVTRETTPITFRQSYDGTLSTLPVSTPEKWTVTKKLPVVKTDSANLDASF